MLTQLPIPYLATPLIRVFSSSSVQKTRWRLPLGVFGTTISELDDPSSDDDEEPSNLFTFFTTFLALSSFHVLFLFFSASLPLLCFVVENHALEHVVLLHDFFEVTLLVKEFL